MSAYRVTVADRRPEGGPFAVKVTRDGAIVGIGASRAHPVDAIQDARREVRYRRAAGQFATDDDACTCEPENAYLCLRCERIAESQDIGS